MPINFYIKNKQNNPCNQKELKYNLKPEEKDQLLPQNIKKFFQCVSYVGCFNLNYIFIHIEDRLYLMNVLPCLQAYIREWLQSNTLIVNQIIDESQQMDLRAIITQFLQHKGLVGQINIDQTIDKILINQHLLAKQYGIVLLEK